MAKHNYIRTPVPLLLDTELSSNDKIVLLYLAWRQGKHKNCFPGIRTIARELCIVKSTAQLSVNRLRYTGYLTVGQKRTLKGKQNTYKINLDLVPKIGTSAYRKSVHNYTTVNMTDPANEKQVGQKAVAKRGISEKETMRQVEKKALTRRKRYRQANQPAKQPETTNPPERQVNHGTE